MKKIKVLHPITRLIVGGAQENTLFTAAMLDKTRFHAEIISGPQTGSEGSLIEEVYRHNVPLTILPELVRQISPMNDLVALFKLVKFMRARDFTIVHTHSSKAGILGRLAAQLAGIPITIHTVHGWSFHTYMSPFMRSIYIFLERWMASFTDALITVASPDINKGLHVGIGKPDQYYLIRSAIPLEEFDVTQPDRAAVRSELHIPLDAIVIGNIGRFSSQKNPLDWIRTAGKIGRTFPNARFLLVGDGPLRSEVEELITSEGIADRTVLTGLRRDVPRLLSAMDIFMLTSLWEGLPRVIPQAMCMGLPVIANLADGTAEAIQDGETGYLCPPGDISSLFERCAYLINHPRERQAMGQKGWAYAAQEFDIRQMVAQITELYESLLTV